MENNQEKQPFFTQKEIELLGLTAEEAAGFDDALSIVETIELLPNDEEKFEEKFEKSIPDNLDDGIESLANLIKSDPEFVTQLYALYDVVGLVREAPAPTVSKLSLDELRNAEAAEVVDDILNV